MLKQEDSGGNNWARACDACRSAASTVYCRADSAFLCAACDSRIHAANKVASRHHRVCVCEVCERAPAAFLCKADAASLCPACDADIHSANPLSRRHHRVPILPIPGATYGPSPVDSGGRIGKAHTAPAEDDGFLTQDVDETIDENDEDEAASWLLLTPPVNCGGGARAPQSNHNNNSNGVLFGGGEVVDEYLDLVEYSSCQENHDYADDHHHHHQCDNLQQQRQHHYAKDGYSTGGGGGGDSVVPVHSGGDMVGKDQLRLHQQQQQNHQSFQLGLEYEASNNGHAYPASLSHSVSISSMDCGVVRETTTSDISISHHRPPKGTIDLFASAASIQMPQQLTPMDREARVLRYREKKKARKFEKTIRYASRKAYAETRPRIKGRFAKRTDAEVEVDQMLSTALLVEGGYGVVPAF